MARDPIPTHTFALVVVRQGNRFLLVHERKHGACWYLPAGRVEPGESWQAAAVRETWEESGVPVTLTGVLRLEHTPLPGFSRLRVIFLAVPKDKTPPRSEPNDDTLGAAWVTLKELDALPLRGLEVRDLLHRVAKGMPVAPLSLLSHEGAAI